jgi:hypothetical protein
MKRLLLVLFLVANVAYADDRYVTALSGKILMITMLQSLSINRCYQTDG